MGEASSVARTRADVAVLKERAARTVSALNAGDPEPLLAGYADDVVVVSPLSDQEDPTTDFIMHGKASFRAFLLTFLEFHGGFEVTDLRFDDTGRVVASILTRSGETKRFVVTMDGDGCGTRVVVFAAE